jgi:predicted transcriptional regulator
MPLLNLETVRNEFITRHESGDTYREIACDYGVNPATVWQIANGSKPTTTIRRRLYRAFRNIYNVEKQQRQPGMLAKFENKERRDYVKARLTPEQLGEAGVREAKTQEFFTWLKGLGK